MPEACSLYELNERIKEVLNAAMPASVWVRAEISEIRENANGHCYLELVEKESGGDRIIAKNKATIWSFTYRMLKPYFESTTKQPLHNGLQILVCCSIEYHELYGLSLNISDIDPTYTLGELALRRQQILLQLQEEGIADMNKEQDMAPIPQRIAIISSETAAGYGDFLDQLRKNSYGYAFYTHLFPAIMQGERAEQSLIEALDKIYTNLSYFDVVVIIRGGGATADLSCFDRYSLAAHCSQFPLPILTGIGHQRDMTILDEVAFASLKTPTAVAEFLVSRMLEANASLTDRTEQLMENIATLQKSKTDQLHTQTRKIPHLLSDRTGNQKIRIEKLASQIHHRSQTVLHIETGKLSGYTQPLANLSSKIVQKQKHVLEHKDLQLNYTNPLAIIEKGYTLTYKNGKRVTSSANLQPGDTITTAFRDGSVESVVKIEKTD